MISGIILASGFSRRMQRDKLLLPVGGLPVVERVIRAAMDAELDEVILVWREQAIEAIGTRCGVKTVFNPLAATGQSAAVRLGVAAAEAQACAWMFLVGDQPFIAPALIDRLIDAARQHPGNIVVPRYGDAPGSPVVFPVRHRQHLLALQGDEGGRALLRRFPDDIVQVHVRERHFGLDIDTQDAYTEALKKTMKTIDIFNVSGPGRQCGPTGD